MVGRKLPKGSGIVLRMLMIGNPNLHYTLLQVKARNFSRVVKLETFLRVKKVFKEPGAEDRHRPLRQASLRPPRVAVHHGHLLERPLLPQGLVDDLQPRRLTPRRPRGHKVLLPHGLLRRLDLTHDPVPQAPEVPRHGLRGQRRVDRRCPAPHHRFEGRHHGLHLIAVVPVSSIHLYGVQDY